MSRRYIFLTVLFSLSLNLLAVNPVLAEKDYYVYDQRGLAQHCTQDGDSIYCNDATNSGGANLDQMRRAGYVTEAEANQRNVAAVVTFPLLLVHS